MYFHIYIHILISTHMFMYIHTYIHTHKYICKHIYMVWGAHVALLGRDNVGVDEEGRALAATPPNVVRTLLQSHGQNLAVTFLNVPKSDRNCLICAILAVTVLYVPYSAGGCTHIALLGLDNVGVDEEGRALAATPQNVVRALPESQGQNLAVTVLYVPESGRVCLPCTRIWP